MRSILITITILLLVGMYSCKKETNPNFPNEPQIYYNSISQRTVDFFDTNTRVIINCGFNDGDGNIGTTGDSTITLLDYRSDTLFRMYKFNFPVIPKDYRKNVWLQGTFTVQLNSNLYFTPRLDSVHLQSKKDTIVYKIFIQDEAGNVSDTVSTDSVYVYTK